MRTSREIRMLRCSRGYFTYQDMVDGLAKYGIKMVHQTYGNKETGKTPFKTNEIKAIADMWGLPIEEAFEILS